MGAFQNFFQDLLGESLFLSDSELKCLVCHWGADALVSYAHKGWDPTDFLSVATTLCHWLKIEDKASDSPYNIYSTIFVIVITPLQGRTLFQSSETAPAEACVC